MGRKVVVLVALGSLMGAVGAGIAAWYFVQSSTLVLGSERPASVVMPEEITAQVSFAEPAGIQFAQKFTVNAAIESQMEVPVQSTFSIPLDFEFTLPVDASMRIDQTFEVEMDVPIRFELTPEDMQLGRLTVDLDTEVRINDEVEVDLMVPVDATLSAFGFMPVPISGTIPVSARIPVNQPVRIRDTVDIAVADFSLDIDTVVPVRMQVPIHQDVKVRGEVTGRIHKTIEVPISERISVPIKQTVPVGLHLAEGVKITMEDFIPTRIRFDDPLPIQVRSMRIAPGDLRIERSGPD